MSSALSLGDAANLRAVIADDAVGMRILLRAVVESAGVVAVVAEAGTGNEAITAVERYRPDLLILDLAMPEMDGLQALPHLGRSIPGGRIIVISGFAPSTVEAEALRLGADRYVAKGTAAAEIRRVVLEVLSDRIS